MGNYEGNWDDIGWGFDLPDFNCNELFLVYIQKEESKEV